MPAEEIIRQYGEEPLYKSIGPVAAALASRSLFVPTDPGAPAGKLRLRTDVDNQGNMWAYAYTSAAELSKAFPRGVNHIELAFPVFFNIVADDQRFRGIYLNAGLDSLYPIPREVFQAVKEALPSNN